MPNSQINQFAAVGQRMKSERVISICTCMLLRSQSLGLSELEGRFYNFLSIKYCKVVLKLNRKFIYSFDLLLHITRYIRCNTANVHINNESMPYPNINYCLHFISPLFMCHGSGVG